MTAAAEPSQVSTWAWWEGRRLRYNMGLFIAGWVGFGIQAAAITWLWWAYSIGTNLVTMALFQGLIYLLYMAGANILYLLGAVVEGVLRPVPVDGYRTGAWRLGFWSAVILPVLVAIVITAMFVAPFLWTTP